MNEKLAEYIRKRQLQTLKNISNREFFVRVKETDERLGVKKDEVYLAKSYWLDPQSKVTLIRRCPDGYDPSCNLYRHEIEVVQEPDDIIEGEI